MNKSLAESDYEGWVAWIDDVPIFESVGYNPNLLPLVPNANSLEYRGGDRNLMEWKSLPHDKITRVELYFARDVIPNQPVWRADREPGFNMRFIQIKIGGIVVDSTRSEGQKRLGLIGYKMGFWIPGRKECQMWEITRSNGIKFMGNVTNPCAPKPVGFGFNKIIAQK